ncbi:hypothetical protein BC781_105262 [Sediminitomix flava]|uniref:Uncharacterized protein n=2 Tax=Sediminitomix flava TaxID=379075 RepID=A0A315Z7R5_SEDFL|nr:hypothetical protein BC781_105262 [Sediminitomix flava]
MKHLLLITILFFQIQVLSAQTIDKVRGQFTNSVVKTTRGAYSSSSSNPYDSELGILEGLFYDLIFVPIVAIPFWSLTVFPEEYSPFKKPLFGQFVLSDYPYQNDGQGRFHKYSLEESIPKNSDIELRFSYLKDESTLHSYKLDIKYYLSHTFKINFEHNQFFEKITKDTYDRMNQSILNIDYIRARHSKIAFWWGGGLSFLNLDDKTFWAPLFSTGLELFPLKPFHLESKWHIGSYAHKGELVDMLQGETGLGFYIKNLKIFTSYRLTKIGDVRINGMAFGLAVHI